MKALFSNLFIIDLSRSRWFIHMWLDPKDLEVFPHSLRSSEIIRSHWDMLSYTINPFNMFADATGPSEHRIKNSMFM